VTVDAEALENVLGAVEIWGAALLTTDFEFWKLSGCSPASACCALTAAHPTSRPKF
jgi:hypothetical protein